MKLQQTTFNKLMRYNTNYLTQMFGFTSNPQHSMQRNFQHAISANILNSIIPLNTSNTTSKKLSLIKQQPRNLTTHNLCQTKQPPPGTTNLLGLGLKFCLASPKPSPKIKDTMRKLAYRIRTKYYLQEHPSTNHDYIPQIYVKLKGWDPPPAPLHVENAITEFEKQLKITTTQNTQNLKQNSSNLTPLQQETLAKLKKSTDFIIMPTDKNLGPAIMDRDKYIKQNLIEHLLTDNYQQLSTTEATLRLQQTKQQLKETYYTYKNTLSLNEQNFFNRSFKNSHRTPIFYGMPKVHKTPLKFRPVVSCVNSFTSIFSTWLDFRMKQILHLIPSYIKDSTALLQQINILHLPTGSKLFTADATSMYTNIKTDIGIRALNALLTQHKESSDPHFPKDFFLTTMEIIMNNNIFMFGDTYWLQLKGTAMGTPAAPLYSILTFGHHENTNILNHFRSNLLFYKRYIDDIFGIWIDTPQNNWENFKTKLNEFGDLRWNVEDLSNTTTFLDLELSIQNHKIYSKTYQKPLNLYLYIPPHSAHPKSCFKGFITGELLRYWRQNTNKADYLQITSLFIQRLLQRGHSLEDILPLIQSATSYIDNLNNKPHTEANTSNNNNTLYIHWKHHPNDIKKKTLRALYNNTLQGKDSFEHMRIAVSRPHNLRDLLCHTRLPTLSDNNVSTILTKINSDCETSC